MAMIKHWILSLFILTWGTMTFSRENQTYQSPYSVTFVNDSAELIGDLKTTPRGDPHLESTIPFAEWSSHKVRQKYEAWGPPARHYPPMPGFNDRSAEWKRERVIAVALRFQGYGYQHHHIPDWNPPAGWPWKEVRSGHNGKGVDCSNFTAFVYNQAFGIKMGGGIHEQAEETHAHGPGENHQTRIQKIDLPKDYDQLQKTLKTGDLLYIRNKEGKIAHVVLWVGSIGNNPTREPLIIDSHGEGVKDSQGNSIPHGVHLRPFNKDSWYFHGASHAHRIIQ